MRTTCIEKCVNIGIRDTELPVVSAESGLSVFVLFSSADMTLRALAKARELALPLGANIVVLAIKVVPYPLPLDQPPIPFEFLIKQLEEKAVEFPEKIQVAGYLCRDPLDALKHILDPYSPVVIGIRKTWLPCFEKRLARQLCRAGYGVITVNQE